MATNAIGREVDCTISEALSTGTFWTYVAATMFRACIPSSPVAHVIPHLTKGVGFAYQTAADALGMIVLTSVSGRLAFGWLGDKFDKRLFLLGTCVLQALGIRILINRLFSRSYICF